MFTLAAVADGLMHCIKSMKSIPIVYLHLFIYFLLKSEIQSDTVVENKRRPVLPFKEKPLKLHKHSDNNSSAAVYLNDEAFSAIFSFKTPSLSFFFFFFFLFKSLLF